MPKLLTRREAAEFLRFSVHKLDDLRMSGALPYIKSGGSVRLIREDVLCLLDRNRVVA